MKRSVVTYSCDNNCGTKADVEHIQDTRQKGDTPLPEGWLDIIALNNVGPDDKIGGQYCPDCIRAISFSLMEVKMIKDLDTEPEVKVEEAEKNISVKPPTARVVSEILKKNVDHNKLVDVSAGAEKLFGISKVKLNTALKLLKDQGYQVLMRSDKQANTTNKTLTKVLGVPETKYKDLFDYEIHPLEVTRKGLTAMAKAAK